jgi:hypothetical protein
MEIAQYTRWTLRSVFVLTLLMTAVRADARQLDSTPARPAGAANDSTAGPGASAESARMELRRWHLAVVQQAARVEVETTRASSVQQQGRPQRPKAARVARRIALGAALGLAGFLGGGFLGASLEPDCHCDDPGLRGALIGAPIGATVGAIVGVTLAK